jgi:hypothetical protein
MSRLSRRRAGCKGTFGSLNELAHDGEVQYLSCKQCWRVPRVSFLRRSQHAVETVEHVRMGR